MAEKTLTKKEQELIDIYKMSDESKGRRRLSKEQIDAIIKEDETVNKASGGSICGRPTGKGFGKARKR